jgi:hypothetical protein
MAQMRARAFALRDVFPDLLSGNLAEEFEGLAPERVERGPDHARDITPPPARPDLVTWTDQYGAEWETTEAEKARLMLDIVASASSAELAEFWLNNIGIPQLVVDAIEASAVAIKVYSADGKVHSVCATHRDAVRKLTDLVARGDRIALIGQNQALLAEVKENDSDARWRDGAAAMLAELEATMSAEAAE